MSWSPHSELSESHNVLLEQNFTVKKLIKSKNFGKRLGYNLNPIRAYQKQSFLMILLAMRGPRKNLVIVKDFIVKK